MPIRAILRPAAVPVLAAAIGATLAIAVACGGGSDVRAEERDVRTVQGLVLEVSARSLLELDSIVVQDAEGQRWRLDGASRSFSGFSPSHLREHSVLGQPVAVSFYEEKGSLVIVGITD